jgi:F0F1-type ATP synthase membrane subunit c/vacuolar-type H+-ATPase subunit K
MSVGSDSVLTRRELPVAGAGVAAGAALAGCGIGRGIQGDVNRVIEPG